jgi:sulfite exporter TauE/SafE
MWAAFLIGLIGGSHCMFMCGPLILFLRHNRKSYSFQKFSLHQISRILGYAVLGGVAGLVGYGFSLAFVHRYVSLVLGGLLVYTALSALLPFPDFLYPKKWGYVNKWLSSIYCRLSSTSYIPLGVLNAFLPCGLVYTALAASATYFDPMKGALFMVFFGAGTIPALLLVFFIPNTMLVAKKKKVRFMLPLTTMLVGLLLILRGLSIGIPYLSPAIEQMEIKPQGSQYECAQIVENKKPRWFSSLSSDGALF